MSKVDVSKIVSDMQKLYQKDKKVQSIISTGDRVKIDYKDEDLIKFSNSLEKLGNVEKHPLEVLIGLPGLPFNKIVQFAGKPDTGKSTLACEMMKRAQDQDVQVILWDAEQKFDASRFQHNFRGDPSKLLMINTNEILKGGELVRRYITAVKEQDPKAKILFVWDSVGASQSRSHAERELDNEKHAQPGQDAKENGSIMKAVVSLINKYPDSIAVILVNQTYAKIGFMQHGDAAAGGTKIEYHSSFIAMLKKIKTLTKVVKGVVNKTGIISRITATKNHLSRGTSVHQLDMTVGISGASLTDSVSLDLDEE